MSQEDGNKPPKKWAKRGGEQRQTVCIVLPTRQILYVKRLARRLNQSDSVTYAELLDEAIGGKTVAAS